MSTDDKAEDVIEASLEKKHTIENIFDYVGGFGLWQFLILTLIYTQTIPNAMITYMVIFSQSIPDHRCSVPTLENPPYNFTVAQLSQYALPSDNTTCGDVELDQCKQYDVDWAASCGSGHECSGTEIATLSAEGAAKEPVFCQNGYIWDNETFTSTVVTEYDFVCTSRGRTFQVLTASLLYIGNIFGSFIAGWVSDTFGRKWSMFGLHTIMTLIVLLEAFTPNEYVYMVYRFLQGVFAMAVFLPAFVYSIEVVPERHRVWAGVGFNLVYTIGEITLAWMATYYRDWRDLTLNMVFWCVPFFLTIFIYDTPESLMKRGRIEEVTKLFQQVGKVNRKGTEKDKIEEIVSQIEIEETDKGEQTTVVDLFRHGRPMAVTTLKACYLWLASSVVYYGIGMNMNSLPGSVYMNTAVNGAIDFVAHLITPFVLNVPWIGRKRTICGGLLLAAISCLVSNIIVQFKTCDEDTNAIIDGVVLAFAYMGKMTIGATFASVYVYVAELFPTPCRANGVGLASLLSKIFTTLTPVIMALELIAAWLPGVVFAAVALLGSVLVLGMPETLGIPSLQTYREANAFYTGRSRVDDDIGASTGVMNKVVDCADE